PILALCAECALVGQLHMTGGGRIAAFYCVDGQGNVLMPCGRCRQLLYEFRAPGMQLMTTQGIKSMDQVLPDAFGPENLEETTGEALKPSTPFRSSPSNATKAHSHPNRSTG